MRLKSVWKTAFGLGKAVVEDAWIEDDGRLVVAVRLVAKERDRCPYCRRRCPGYDLGEGRRRWRTLDVGMFLAYLEPDAPRVRCQTHGVVLAAVPWARHAASFTRQFEDQVAWLTVQASKTAGLCPDASRGALGRLDRHPSQRRSAGHPRPAGRVARHRDR